MHYYSFHIGDYASHTGHLSVVEDAAYRRLLDRYYLREEPLPSDVGACARLVRMAEHETEVGAVLREFFREESGWHHDRADAEIAECQRKRNLATAAGKASGQARRERSLNGRSTDVEPRGDVEPPVPSTHLPVPKVQSTRSARPSPSAPPVVQPDGLSDQVWSDFKKHRKGKITATGIESLRKKAKEAGMTLEEAMVHMMAMGHQGFFPPRAANSQNGRPTPPVEHQRNAPLGTTSCQCSECARWRAKNNPPSRLTSSNGAVK